MNPGHTPPPDKKDYTEKLLAKGSVYLHLDPRLPGVRVPKWLRYDAQLILQVGFDMPIPIMDLRLDETGVSATLSFQRSPHFCQVPWSAVFAVAGEDGRGMLWPENLPQELFNEVAREAAREGFDGDLGSILEDFEDDLSSLDAPSEIRSAAASRPLRLVSEPPPRARAKAPKADAAKADAVASAPKKDSAKKRTAKKAVGAGVHADTRISVPAEGRDSSVPPPPSADESQEVVQPMVRGRALPSYLRVVK